MAIIFRPENWTFGAIINALQASGARFFAAKQSPHGLHLFDFPRRLFLLDPRKSKSMEETSTFGKLRTRASAACNACRKSRIRVRLQATVFRDEPMALTDSRSVSLAVTSLDASVVLRERGNVSLITRTEESSMLGCKLSSHQKTYLF
jgi:hypothetical protein